MYSNGAYTTINDPLGTGESSVYDINASGMAVGNYGGSDGKSHGFIYHNGTYQTIDDPLNTTGTQVIAINDEGEVAGIYGDGTLHGFVYNNGVYTTVDDPLGVGQTYVYSIDDNGEVAGYYLDGAVSSHGFVATPTIAPLPQVTSVTATTSDGARDLTVGQLVTITVTTSEAVTVSAGGSGKPGR